MASFIDSGIETDETSRRRMSDWMTPSLSPLAAKTIEFWPWSLALSVSKFGALDAIETT